MLPLKWAHHGSLDRRPSRERGAECLCPAMWACDCCASSHACMLINMRSHLHLTPRDFYSTSPGTCSKLRKGQGDSFS
jgi:hypothetical protein